MKSKANIELLLLNRMLKGNSKEQQKYLEAGLKSDMFHTFTEEYQWAEDFKAKYGKYPGRVAFKKKFPEFTWLKSKEAIEYYLTEIVERENLLGLQKIAAKVKPLIDQGKVSEAMNDMRAALENAVRSVDQVVTNWKRPPNERYAEAVQNRAQLLKAGKSYTTPYRKLNKCIVSVRPGDLVTLTARLGIGKTWILLMFALHFMRCGAKVLFISKEMPADQIEDRLDAIDGRLDWPRFLRGNLALKQRKRYKKMLVRRKSYSGELRIVGETAIEGSGLNQMLSGLNLSISDNI